ncbi:MAG: type I DNA topoisomerase [Anaeromyxobacteraceae bacterium]
MGSYALVIVESPAKGKTIERYLGSGYRVMPSVGHIVDLPEGGGLQIDVENGFEPTYVVTKPDVVKGLKAALKEAKELYLATDEDREGEAISYHLHQQLKPRVPVHRMVFHEITKKAIQEALEHTREIDGGLVAAQETRRVLDRLYGYELSPLLWKKVKPRLSAGRVQSPALRLVVERERERMAFRSVAYWDVVAKHPTAPEFQSTLAALDGKRVAAGKDFDAQGKLQGDARPVDEATARALAGALEGKSFTVKRVERKPYRSSPRPPFITSTLQQEAGRKLRLGAREVMRTAQGLYERGFITYMRTDSVTLSETALAAARGQIAELFGQAFVAKEPRRYTSKSKNAQEAHEAIRPAGDTFRTPDEVKRELSPLELRLYELIWKRTLASQMADAEGESVNVRLDAPRAAGLHAEFNASGRTISFPGYLRAYVEGEDDPDAKLEDREAPLPKLEEGQVVPVSALEPLSHTTSPPARYTEASLVKKLEELGIGRPSTYASIMATLQERRYIRKKGQALVPEWVSFPVVRLLEEHFGDLVEYAFTAELEEDLDKIAGKEMAKLEFLKEFYFGTKRRPGLKGRSERELGKIDAALMSTIPVGKADDGEEIVVRVGRYGPYLKKGEQTATVPESLAPDELSVAKAVEILATPQGGKTLGVDPASGQPVIVRTGRFGPYVQLGEPPKGEKPEKTRSLLSHMKPETLTLEEALSLLTLPRVLGHVDGEDVVVDHGRYGAYVRHGKETRNLGGDREAEVLTLTLEQAQALLAQPKTFRGRGTPKPPLASFEKDPTSGKPIVLKEGRFGPYVTDGETNASLRRGEDPSELTWERAVELLVERRAALASPDAGRRAARGKPKRRGAKADLGVAPAPKAVAAGAEKPAAKAPKAAGGKKAAAPKKKAKKG